MNRRRMDRMIVARNDGHAHDRAALVEHRRGMAGFVVGRAEGCGSLLVLLSSTLSLAARA
jgi:hypothetical protein